MAAAVAALAFGSYYGARSVLGAIAEPVQTSGFPCRQPTEHEQLHIVVAWKGEVLTSACMYVGSRGTYAAGRR